MKVPPGLLALVLVASSLAAITTAQSPLRARVASPLDYQVVQRTTASTGRLIVAGSIGPATRDPLPVDAITVRLTGRSLSGDLPGDWKTLPFDPRVADFRGELIVPAGGWYRMEVRALRAGVEISATAVEHVGLGEVFVVAGQSNAANYGEERQTTHTGLVAAFDGTRWQVANDPQPGAGGTKGSFMPSFGDAMAERVRVPIGIVATAIGATSVREWLPPGTRISPLPTLTHNVVTIGQDRWEASGRIFLDFIARIKPLGAHGFRAVLWHQGESDASQTPPDRTLPGDLYRDDLAQVIRASRKEIGWEAPWFVAQATSHGSGEGDRSSPDIRRAQKSLWESGIALEGPDTDALTGDMRENHGTGVHLSGEGLREHGLLWVAKVAPWLERQLR